MVAPPYFTVPPAGYGGVESVVADLVDGLVDRGHHVTLIGAGQPGTRAQRFIATTEQASADRLGEPLPEITHAALAAGALESCDVELVHDHTLAGPLLGRGRDVPTLVTVHGELTDDAARYYGALGPSVRLIGISDAQRATAATLPWLATVHNSIDVESFPFRADKEDYAVFLGRYHQDKGPHLAIDAARAAGLRIVLAGKCTEPGERAYFAREIEPRLGPDVELVGVADAETKRGLLAGAACLLFPVRWDEPFGLVMIEAMACGTPVVALRRGAVPEVVMDGVTGVLVDHPAHLADAVHRARTLDPHACRRHAEQHFSTAVMVQGYEKAYRRALHEHGATISELDGRTGS
jgi:glycosyltransferase involved in cell wall biosynthesis